MATIGENIKRIRKEKGLTQKQLGALCKPSMADSAIRRYEAGKANPKLATVRKIAEALDCKLYELVDDWTKVSPEEWAEDMASTAKTALSNTSLEDTDHNTIVIDTEIDKNHPFNIIQKKINNGEKLTQEEIHLYNRHLKQSADATMQSLKKFGETLRSAYSEYYELLNEKGKIEADKIIDKATKQAQEQSEEQVKLLTKIPEYRKDASSDHKTPKADQENFKTDPKE